MGRFVLIAPLTLLAADAFADTLYRCQDAKGRVTFSDEPCGPAAARSVLSRATISIFEFFCS
jgi:hypothetical protein